MSDRTVRKNLKNYTTTIKVEKTIMEIQTLLVAKGAQKIMTEYENGVAVGLTFLLNSPKGQIPVQLPARIEKVRKIVGVERYAENADKIAWRNIKDWVDAQIALIETEMVTVHEVFLPYMIMGEQTLFEKFADGKLLNSA